MKCLYRVYKKSNNNAFVSRANVVKYKRPKSKPLQLVNKPSNVMLSEAKHPKLSAHRRDSSVVSLLQNDKKDFFDSLKRPESRPLYWF